MTSRRAALLLALPCLIALTALFVAPQALMFESSLGRRSFYGGVVHQWSLDNYRRALEPLYLAILARSVALALATTQLCHRLAYTVSYLLGRKAPVRGMGGRGGGV
jgi:spermidine/putrescine transport system permease protein